MTDLIFELPASHTTFSALIVIVVLLKKVQGMSSVNCVRISKSWRDIKVKSKHPY